MELISLTVGDFLNVLASNEPAPGGGSVSALAGANAASLCAMVCSLTIGREKFKEAEAQLIAIREEAGQLKKQLELAIDEDTNAFNQVMDAFHLPKATEEEKQLRKGAIQTAYVRAVKVPLSVVEACLSVLRLLPAVVEKGNPNALSDAGVAAAMALAGLEGARLNVQINLPSITSAEQKELFATALSQATAEARAAYKDLAAQLEEKLS